jgi:2-polyprenyl-3-methyl-5-hydroxy-6-metoxy-1,4-benzoquinol methylase
LEPGPQKSVDSTLYDKDYFTCHCRGQDLTGQIGAGELHEIYRRAFQTAALRPSDRVLDYGCGRGELVYGCAQMGCFVTGVDVSEDAVALTRETLSTLPREIQNRIVLKKIRTEDAAFKNGSFDVIFMIDVLEHLYEWELDILMPRLRNALKENGRLIIQTPNLLYETFFYPVKRLAEFPFTLIKEVGRVIRRTGKRKNAREFFRKLFKFHFHDDPVYQKVHVNVQTPRSLGKMLSRYGFQSRIQCIDHSKNLISIITRRWTGRTIEALARPRQPVCGPSA